jgi:hypothetical protein
MRLVLDDSMVFYGSETRNAQVAFSNEAKTNGRPQIKSLQSPFNPFGRGFGLHALRNVLAMSGFRVFSAPCQDTLAKINPSISPSSKGLLTPLPVTPNPNPLILARTLLTRTRTRTLARTRTRTLALKLSAET